MDSLFGESASLYGKMSWELHRLLYWRMILLLNLTSDFRNCLKTVRLAVWWREFDIKSKNRKLVHHWQNLRQWRASSQKAVYCDNWRRVDYKVTEWTMSGISICTIFFSSSLTASIKALLLSRILSAILISKFFMLLLPS